MLRLKKTSLAGMGGAEASPSFVDAFLSRSRELLTRAGEHFTENTASSPSDPPLDGEVLEFSVLIGNEDAESKIPLNGLRVRFRGDPVTSSQELPGQSRALEVVSDPTFISMDGMKTVAVEGGAWSLEPASWGRLANGAGGGKYVMWFWVDLKVPVVKNGFGIPEGRRLFFAINVLEQTALPKLLADIQELDTKIASYKELGRQKKSLLSPSWIEYVRGYDDYTKHVAQRKTLAIGVPSSSDKMIDFGRFCIRKNKTGVVALNQGKQFGDFGQAGTFHIKGEVARDLDAAVFEKVEAALPLEVAEKKVKNVA
jgi:hypothetical protein